MKYSFKCGKTVFQIHWGSCSTESVMKRGISWHISNTKIKSIIRLSFSCWNKLCVFHSIGTHCVEDVATDKLPLRSKCYPRIRFSVKSYLVLFNLTQTYSRFIEDLSKVRYKWKATGEGRVRHDLSCNSPDVRMSWELHPDGVCSPTVICCNDVC
jgi:hypothetical protein